MRPVRFFELPVISPPRVKALMVRAVPLYWERVLAKRPVVAVRVVVERPLARARLPAKLLEPVPVEMNWARVSMPLVAWRPLATVRLPAKEEEPALVNWSKVPERPPPAWRPRVVWIEPAKEEEPVDWTMRLPPILAYEPTSKPLVMEAMELVS